MNTEAKYHSEKSHYLSVFFFSDATVIKQEVYWYNESEALQMFQRGINKYKDSGIPIMIIIRDRDHNLIEKNGKWKIELLNYAGKINGNTNKRKLLE